MGITSRGEGLSPPQQWQSAPQPELAAGARHLSLHLILPVLEPKVLRRETHEQREARAMMSVAAKKGKRAQRHGRGQSKQLQMAQTALWGREDQRAIKGALQIMPEFSKVGKSMSQIKDFVSAALG